MRSGVGSVPQEGSGGECAGDPLAPDDIGKGSLSRKAGGGSGSR